MPAGKKRNTKQRDKDPHAVALGKKGGKKGGPARARALSKQERERIARLGAKAKKANEN